MNKLLALKPHWAVGLFVLLDIICIGMGMGVPIFCIMLGVFVGWYIVRSIIAKTTDMREVFRRIFLYAIVAAAVTMLGMAAIWGPFALQLFDPNQDLADTGIPMILFEPLPSFIGWIMLMIVISPTLQFLTTLFGAHLTLLGWLNAGGDQYAPA